MPTSRRKLSELARTLKSLDHSTDILTFSSSFGVAEIHVSSSTFLKEFIAYDIIHHSLEYDCASVTLEGVKIFCLIHREEE